MAVGSNFIIIKAAKSSPEQLKSVKVQLQPMLQNDEYSSNYNPFETKHAMQNSLPSHATAGPIVNDEDLIFNPFETKVKMQNSPTVSGNGRYRLTSSPDGDENHDPNVTVHNGFDRVASDQVKYTTKDMDLIRREARVDADSARKELSQLQIICLQYDKTIIELQHMRQTELEKKDRAIFCAIGDRENLRKDLTALTTAKVELENKYTRGRSAHKNLRINEEKLNVSLKQHDSLLKEEQRRYQVLEANSCEVVQLAKIEVEQRKSTNRKENVVLNNELKRLRLKTQSLENQVKQKTVANDELTKICDDLIANRN